MKQLSLFHPATDDGPCGSAVSKEMRESREASEEGSSAPTEELALRQFFLGLAALHPGELDGVNDDA